MLDDNRLTKQSGFTLLELMVVVAIIGIIAAIAYPSYQKYALRAHRADARNVLQEIVQILEERYTANRSYAYPTKSNKDKDKANQALKNNGLSQSPASGTARYKIEFLAAPTASKYTIIAVPTGPQANDKCKTFTIDQSNVKTAGKDIAGGKVAAKASDSLSRECWSR